MRLDILACDYDGTLATEGRVAAETLAALARLRSQGGRVVLVTGRQLDDLQLVCPRLDGFDHVVAENGALLFDPGWSTVEMLAAPPPPAFLQALHRAGVPFSVGRSIVATVRPHDAAVGEVIRALGIDLVPIFNKESVMVLPRGVTKGTGLRAALGRLRLARERTVAVGDAENDAELFAECAVAVAVANAVPALAAQADLVTAGPNGAGVRELVDRLLRGDLP
jgi:hydroxymethylpyrimidine pyrophosphatase-like HAD family hydrolase